MTSDPVAVHVTVKGSVQGVFFRDTCRQEAESRDVHGWVANRPDGAVEAVFEGPRDAVDELVRWAHSGPEGAEVNDVTTDDVPVAGLSGFEVRA